MKSEERKKELQAQRKRLEAFDRTFQKENDFMTSGKTLFWIYVVFEIITFLIIVGTEGRMENIVGITTGFAICATGYYMRDYCYTTEQNKRVSLWKKVSAAPIERSVFVASRVGYLSRILRLRGCIAPLLHYLDKICLARCAAPSRFARWNFSASSRMCSSAENCFKVSSSIWIRLSIVFIISLTWNSS